MRGSLLGRLLWRLTLVSVLLVAIIASIVVVQFRSTADTLRDRNLSGQANDIARHLNAGEDGRVRLDLPEALRSEYAHSGGMFVYQVIDGSGEIAFSSHDSIERLFTPGAVEPGAIEFFRVDRPIDGNAQPFYGASLAVRRGARSFVIQVAQGPLHSDALLDEFFEELWDHAGWIVALVFVAVVIVIYVTVRASLATVAAAAREAAAIGPRSLDRRIATTGVPIEVRPLVEAFNNALDRIGESYRRQREFTANAAHELRTPLAVLRAHVDSLADRTVAQALDTDLVRLDRLVGQLLRLARADELRIPDGSRAELNAVAIETAALMAPGAIAEGKSVAVNEAAEPVAVFGDAGQIGIALRNLIENALRATPKGTTVEVTVDPAGALAVADAGPGVSADIRGKMFERFWRDDPSTEGAGLGLSIVGRIVEAHDGRIDVTDAPGGGAVFTLHFKLID